MSTTQLELVTPEALLLSESVSMVVIPGTEGDMGVMVDHAPTVTSLRPGLVSVYDSMTGAATRKIFVGGGVAEVRGDCCTLLAEEAIDLNDLSKESAQARLAAAEAALSAANSDSEKAQALTELTIAQAQMGVLGAH